MDEFKDENKEDYNINHFKDDTPDHFNKSEEDD